MVAEPTCAISSFSSPNEQSSIDVSSLSANANPTIPPIFTLLTSTSFIVIMFSEILFGASSLFVPSLPFIVSFSFDTKVCSYVPDSVET